MKTVIVTIVKNEQLYLDEWIQFHSSLGIDKIIIVEDFDSNSHKNITDKYTNVDIYSLSNFYDKNNFVRASVQSYIANYFATILSKDYDWLTFLDPDEFIMCAENLQDILSRYKNEIGILMKWSCFNANEHFKRPKNGTLINYTKVTKNMKGDFNYHTKVFGNLSKNPIWKNPHDLEQSIKVVPEFFLNHYVTRSFEDYCYKIYQRGDIYHRVYRDLSDFYDINKGFDKEKCEKFIKDKYDTLDEYIVNINDQDYLNDSFKILTVTPFFKLEYDLINIGNPAQCFDLKLFSTLDPSTIKYEDSSGLYSFEIFNSRIKIIAKEYKGGGIAKHKIHFYNDNINTYLYIFRYDTTTPNFEFGAMGF